MSEHGGYMENLERKFEMIPSFDKAAEGYGIGAAIMRFYVVGPKGAVQFVLSTGWYPNIIKKTTFTDWSDWGELEVRKPGPNDAPMPWDLGWHSPVPRYEGQEPMSGECSVIQGECYYDGSGLNANKPFSILVHEGSDRLWEFLELYYRETFEEKAVA
jgi:hypothetical protein